MTGRIIKSTELPHHCNPGVTYKPIAPESDLYPLVGPNARSACPPNRHSHPPGTIWQCDNCSREWISYRPAGADRSGMIGRIWWRRHRPVRWWCGEHPVAFYLLCAMAILIIAAILTWSGIVT